MMSTRIVEYVIVALFFIVTMAPGISAAQNIVSNSGFEAGNVGELPKEWRDQKEGGAEGRVVLTNREAHSGKKSIFIEHTNADGYIHPNKSVEIEAGDYTFGFWARSDEKIEFSAQIYRETDWGILLSESCNLKNDKWTKFEFPFSSLKTFPGSIQIGLTVPGRLWLDDVELVKQSSDRKIANIQILTQQGDTVLDNEYLTVVFHSEAGKVLIHSKAGKKRAELVPLPLKGKPAVKITSCKVLLDTDDAATIKANFSAEGKESSVVFSFSRDPVMEIKPAGNGVSISAPIQYAVVPSFISDDLVYAPVNYSAKILHIPSENFLMGLLNGEDGTLVFTWPRGNQKVDLGLSGDLFGSVDIENDGESVYLALLDAPGIWHEEELKASYLEKAIAIDWERPFPAKWITQLYEDGVKTEFTFRESESKQRGFWRAGVGWFTYPVWFKEEKAFFHLGKKIPPKGESLIYSLERRGTPVSVFAPADILRGTLDDKTYESIIDSEGRRNRSLTRPSCTVGTATCGVTDRLKPVFEAGEEVEKREYIKGGTEDMIYFLTRERERALEYQDFAHEMIEFLTLTKKDKPELKSFLDEMEVITREIIAAYEHAKDNIKDIEYARKLARKTQALTQQKNPGNFEAFMKLKGEWTGMGGAVDDLNRKLHTTTRKLFQEAGYNCVGSRETVEVAEEIRRRTVKCLRRPGSYEIWSDY